MKKVIMMLVLSGFIFMTGCSTVKVVSPRFIHPGETIAFNAPENLPGIALKVEINLGNFSGTDRSNIETLAGEQGIEVPNLANLLKGNCWVLINCDTNDVVINAAQEKKSWFSRSK